MESQAFEIQICAKAETRGLKMALLVKSPQAVVSVISRANQVGFKQVFDNLTVKHMDILRNRSSVIMF